MNRINTLFVMSVLAIAFYANGDIRTPHMPRLEERVEQPSFRRAQKVEKKERKKPERILRKGLQGITYRKTISEMDYDELKEVKNRHAESNNWHLVVTYLKPMLKLAYEQANSTEHANLILELADSMLAQGLYDDATKYYKELMHTYPGSERIEYAYYKAIKCTSERMLPPDRDQSKTEETLELTNKFLERADVFTTYYLEVVSIQEQCFKLLAESEMDRGAFYTKQGDYVAAQRRLEGVRNNWLEKVPSIEFQLVSLESELATHYSDFKMPESSLTIVSEHKEHTSDRKKMAQRF